MVGLEGTRIAFPPGIQKDVKFSSSARLVRLQPAAKSVGKEEIRN